MENYICIQGYDVVGVKREKDLEKIKKLYKAICAPISEEELNENKIEIKQI